MRLSRVGLSVFGAIAVAASVLAGAMIWLVLTRPATVADVATEGDITPLVKELASVLYDAFVALLGYL